ncbi:hypothetical protein C8Q79DRAFT_550619 [Trametes meyenii]|nr:hypothetical protein C8Q79DRAFT_550619 [Trametes meyenii]
MASRPLPPASGRSPPPAPKTIRLEPKALLSLPHRLAHPPPPQPKTPSWSITPHFRIPLDEILDRKHLPPLGLKDFEEWLLFIDRAPENLYFILWLRDYSARYSAWARQSRAHPASRSSSPPQARAYRTLSAPHPPPNPALALFYLRAKETFLTPDGPYALRLPSDVLAPFQTSSLGAGVGGPAGGSWRHAFSAHQSDLLLGSPSTPPPPPDPAVFAEVADRVRAVLADSLDRFVVATFHNVGMPRAYCGCAGGTVIGLTGSAPILLANFLTGGSRWWRFTAIPGLWLGLTIVISAMYGVCMMIYVFGDLRQLRSFELARFPEPAPVEKGDDLKHKRKLSIKVLTKRSSTHGADIIVSSPQPVVGPFSPPLLNDVLRDCTAQSPSDAQQNRLPRPSLPKLHIIPPQPAHVHAPVHTSSRTYPSLPQVRSESSVSTFRSGKSGKRNLREPCFGAVSDQEFDTEDDLHDTSGSEDESDYSSGFETDASSEASHASVTDEGVSMNIASASRPARQRRRTRRRRPREPEIHISDAFFDEHPSPEGPATADPQERSGRTSIWGDSSEEDVGTGATFIHAFRWDEDGRMCPHDIESQAHCAAEHQRIDAFDFDGLPPRAQRPLVPLPPSPATTPFTHPQPTPAPSTPVESEKPSRVRFAADADRDHERGPSRRPQGGRDDQLTRFRRFLGFVQQKCGPRNVARQLLGARSSAPTPTAENEKLPEPRTPVSTGPLSPSSTLSPPSPTWAPAISIMPPSSPTSTVTVTATTTAAGRAHAPKTTWQNRVRRMLEVPAFASPLTPVLNPVVTRGQWEIVVRSAIIAFAMSILVVGVLVAVPETRVV